MKIASALYKDSDHNSVLKFLASLRKTGHVCGLFHAGDFIWRTYTSQFAYERNKSICLWRTDSQDIVCMAWLFREDGYGEIFIEPQFFGTEVENEAFAWMERSVISKLQTGEKFNFETGGPINNSPHEFSKMRESGLLKHGFSRGKDIYVQMRINETPDSVPAPSGFSIKTIADGLTIEDLLKNRPHHDVDRYKDFLNIEGYDPKLDIAVVSDDGCVASFCICWYDKYSQSGLLEPVGTDKAYRGKGLARALVNRGVRTLKDKGAQDIFVCPDESNVAAVSLYESVGFEIISRDQTWHKELQG